MSSRPPSKFWTNVGLLSAASLAALVVAITLVMSEDWFRPPSPPSPPPPMPLVSMLFYAPGLQQPPTSAAAEATVPDDAEVLGISAGGRHRAYLLSAMSLAQTHVINDLLGDVPITVTYCNRSQCVCVVTATDRASPLNVDVGGIFENNLLLRIGDTSYAQDGDKPIGGRKRQPLPFPNHPFLRTSWKEWKDAHPETDIFCTIPALPALEPRPPSAKEKPAVP